MSDIALSKNSMMFVTRDGEGFSGQWLGQYKKAVDKKGTKTIRLTLNVINKTGFLTR